MCDIQIREDMHINEYEDAVIVPRKCKSIQGLYDACGRYVKYSGKRLYVNSGYLYSDDGIQDDEVVFEDLSVYFLGDLRCHYGHFIIDEASRLWGYSQMGKDVWVAYNLGGTPKKWLFDFLEYFGIPQNRLILIDKPKRFKKVFYVEPSYIVGKSVSLQWKNVFDRVVDGYLKLSGGVSKSRHKLYLSRSKIRTSFFCHSFGERLIEKILLKNGFEILYPEKMSLGEQIEKYSNAEIMITTNGTLGHNVLYAPSDVKLCVLNRVYSEDVLNRHQMAIGKIMGNEIFTARCSSVDSGHTVSFMWITDELLEIFNKLGIKVEKILLYKILFGIEYFKFKILNYIWKKKNSFIDLAGKWKKDD